MSGCVSHGRNILHLFLRGITWSSEARRFRRVRWSAGLGAELIEGHELLLDAHALTPHAEDHQVFAYQQRAAVVLARKLDDFLLGHCWHLRCTQ